jgi:hypothetical protein
MRGNMATDTVTVTVHGVPLEVEFLVSDGGDITITEVWIKGIEMMCLLDDPTITIIRSKILRVQEATL